MDSQYEKTAAAYGFDCRGCEENCCQTRFYHHTHIETAYFLNGFFRLDTGSQKEALERAGLVASAQNSHRPGSDRLMCPVNKDGWCLLYPYRPMICRLHGIAHELHAPGKPKTYGPGCAEFDRIRGDKAYVPFDRTPFYVRMAALEKEFKAQTGLFSKLRQTIAEMLVDAERLFTREHAE